ncbi:MAG: hypothetical protein AAF648_16230 [Pseudomonadota bacterium]
MQHTESVPVTPETPGFARFLESYGYLAFKYLVYAALFANVFLFLREEWLASNHLFAEGVPLARLIESFAASIDTAAWVLLLALFELETHQLPDDRLTPRVTRTLSLLRFFCYAIIGYAFVGYLSKALALIGSPATFADACSVADGTRSLMTKLDKFTRLDATNCASVAVPWVLSQASVVVDEPVFFEALRLAWTDVINSGSWLLVVALFESEVRLQRLGRLSSLSYRALSGSKLVLYAVLFGCALYWGIDGDFLDFWDASLWLLAFFIIELNVFQWRSETSFAPAAP